MSIETKNAPNKIESLHNHTTTSDGELTHFQLLEEANKLGFGVVAFTDHDSVPSSEILLELKKWENFPTKFLFGIELTSAPPKGCNLVNSFHLIGLFIDPENKNLIEFCASASERRNDRMRFVVGNLQKLGFNITEKDCLRESGGEAVGKPHIVAALKSHLDNFDVMKKLVDDFNAASKKDPTLNVKYPEVAVNDEKSNSRENIFAKSYGMFLSVGAYIKGIYQNETLPSLEECSAIIRQAGGVAILAHYVTMAKMVPVPVVEEWLDRGLLDGCERIYSIEKTARVYGAPKAGDAASTGPSAPSGDSAPAPSAAEKNEADRQALRRACESRGRISWVGGGDIHRLEQLAPYAASPLAQEAIGMTQALVRYLVGKGKSVEHIGKVSTLL